MQAIYDEFPESQHYQWDTRHVKRFSKQGGTDPFIPRSIWAWDALPFYSLSLLRISREEAEEHWKPRPERWLLEISHDADTGFPSQKSEPTSHDVADVEATSSLLGITLWRCDRVVNGDPIWLQVWRDSNRPSEGEARYSNEATGLSCVSTKEDMAKLHSVEDVKTFAQEAHKLGRDILGLPF